MTGLVRAVDTAGSDAVLLPLAALLPLPVGVEVRARLQDVTVAVPLAAYPLTAMLLPEVSLSCGRPRSRWPSASSTPASTSARATWSRSAGLHGHGSGCGWRSCSPSPVVSPARQAASPASWRASVTAWRPRRSVGDSWTRASTSVGSGPPCDGRRRTTRIRGPPG